MDAPENSANKRRSGRVSRKPDVFTEAPATSKRKRTQPEGEGDGEDQGDERDEDDEDEDSESEGEPDEEELREKRARARKAKSAPAKKPVAKRPKTNGSTIALPNRAKNKSTRKKAKALNDEDAEQAGGLYGRSPLSHNTYGQ